MLAIHRLTVISRFLFANISNSIKTYFCFSLWLPFCHIARSSFIDYRVMFTAALFDVRQLVVVEELASVVIRTVVETNTCQRRCALAQASAICKTPWTVWLEWSNASGAYVSTVDGLESSDPLKSIIVTFIDSGDCNASNRVKFTRWRGLFLRMVRIQDTIIRMYIWCVLHTKRSSVWSVCWLLSCSEFSFSSNSARHKKIVISQTNLQLTLTRRPIHGDVINNISMSDFISSICQMKIRYMHLELLETMKLGIFTKLAATVFTIFETQWFGPWCKAAGFRAQAKSNICLSLLSKSRSWQPRAPNFRLNQCNWTTNNK